jgi:hypothetical protein
LVITTHEGFHKKINCGDNAYDVAGWERDDGYVSGGSDLTNTGTITTANVAGAAPDLVYKSMRHQSQHSYNFHGLVPGSYTVRFHWVEPASATVRAMNYTVNGTINLFRDFDIAARAGSINKALVLDRIVNIQDTTLLLQCSGSNSSDVFESGIEIIRNYRDPLTILAPLGGDKLVVGQPFVVRWCADTSEIPSLDVELSTDKGKTWGFISPSQHISKDVPAGAWTHWSWTVPDSFVAENVTKSCVSTTCLMRISNYSHPGLFSRSDSVFTISPRGAVALVRAHAEMVRYGISATLSAQGLRVKAASGGNHRVEILSSKGAVIARFQGRGQCSYCVGANRISAGIYIIRMKADGQIYQKTAASD